MSYFPNYFGLQFHKALVVCLTGAIAACGGGSDDSPTQTPPPAMNQAPTISGSPPTVVVAGQVYSFTPTASDADGDNLIFSVSNQPGWATFDTLDGSMTGTPLPSDVGSYPSVEVAVSDGQQTVTLATFTIDVLPIATGSVMLTWTPPSFSADGSMLNDLKGFRIRWGTQTGSYPNVSEINDSNATNSTVSNLASSTYFFVVTAMDTSDNESVFSNEVIAVVP